MTIIGERGPRGLQGEPGPRTNYMTLFVAALLSALITGLSSYVAFARSTPSRDEVRTIVERNTAGLQEQNQQVFAMLQRVEVRLDSLDAQMIQNNQRLNSVLEELNLLPPGYKAKG